MEKQQSVMALTECTPQPPSDLVAEDTSKWDKWLKDEWYTAVVTYLCFGGLGVTNLTKNQDDRQLAEGRDSNVPLEPKLRYKCKSTVFYRTPAPIIVYYFPYITCLLYLLFLIKHVRTSG